jgi:hypothetical protein
VLHLEWGSGSLGVGSGVELGVGVGLGMRLSACRFSDLRRFAVRGSSVSDSDVRSITAAGEIVLSRN